MPRWQANMILLLTALIWGGSFSIQKIAGAYIEPFWFNGLRFAIGALCLLPIATMEHTHIIRRTGVSPLRHWKLFAITGATLGLAAIIQHTGLLRTSIANASFLTTLYVPLTPLIAVTFFARRPHWIIWPGAIGCLIGTYVLAGGDLTALNTGDLLVIASAILWALHILLIAQCMDKSGAPMTMACVQFAAAAVVGISMGLGFEDITAVDWPNAWWSLVLTGVFAVTFGFTAQVYGQKYTPPSDAAIMLSMEAVFAVIIGALLLGETLAAYKIAGCAMIFFAVLMVEVVPTLKRTRP